MSTEWNDEDEPLLESGELPEDAWRAPRAPESLRADVFRRTAAVLRRRSRRRRALAVSAVMTAYVAGLATAFVALSLEPQRDESVRTATAVTAPEDKASPPAPPLQSAQDLLRDPEQFALLLARSPKEEQRDLLKAAGDAYLNDYGDVQQALNCYRRYLAIPPLQSDTQTDVNDTWLLRSLKQASLEENHHENANS